METRLPWFSSALSLAAVLTVGAGLSLNYASPTLGQEEPAGIDQIDEVEDVEAYWEQFDWADISAADQTLWNILGWDEASWQGESEAPASENTPWNKLTPEEQGAAVALGYGQISWAATVDIEAYWEQFEWSDISAEEQALWGLLGWDEASWQGDAADPASASTRWTDLTFEEQIAAEALGYDQVSWDDRFSFF